jgi:hypothetical protein
MRTRADLCRCEAKRDSAEPDATWATGTTDIVTGQAQISEFAIAMGWQAAASVSLAIPALKVQC